MYNSGLVGINNGVGIAVLVWQIISIVVAIAGAFVMYFVFLPKKNEAKFKGFAKWLYNFFDFKTMTLEVILKICYMVTAFYLTLSSLSFIAVNPLMFFGQLILGNLIARITYEGAILLLKIHKELSEINKNTSKK
jgi:hypothetical protein